MSDIQEKVTAIIVDKLGVDAGEVSTEASFTNDLGADSLDTVELIMEFEKEFNIAIPDDQAEKISTVGQAVDSLSKKVGCVHLSDSAQPVLFWNFVASQSRVWGP